MCVEGGEQVWTILRLGQATQASCLLGSLEQLVQSAGIGSTGEVPQHKGNHFHEPSG